MTGIFAERVRKIMGWCPNASATYTKKSLQFNDLRVNTPDRKGKITHAGTGWLKKYHNKILLKLLVFMYLAVVSFDGYGKVNLDMYLIGIISGLFFHFFSGVNDWHRFNRAAGIEIAQQQLTKKQIAIVFLVIISLIVFIVFVVTNITGGMAFISGTMFFVWIEFLIVLYWEHKNEKTLIMKKAILFGDLKIMRTE
jgi:hypothetical protein